MIEAVTIWNEPNNKSHWDFEIDPDWKIFAEMAKCAADAVSSETPNVLKVLGGISPIDASFMLNMKSKGLLEHFDAVAVHGFPLDWNHWCINEWPQKYKEITSVTELPVWISEVGVSSFGAEEYRNLVCGAARNCWLAARHEFTGRADSPWYPTMRIFQQPSTGEWNSVSSRLYEAMRETLAHNPARR